MRTKLRGMLVLGVGFAIWSCGTEASNQGSDQMAGSAGWASGIGGAQSGIGGSVVGSGGAVVGSGGSGVGGVVVGSGGDGTGGVVVGTGGDGTGGGVVGTGGDATGGGVVGTGGDGTGGSVVGSGGDSSGGDSSGGDATGGGVVGSGGDATGGVVGSGGDSSGGDGTGGDGTGGDGTGGDGTGGNGGASTIGPCDIYADAGTPCVAAYSMVRVLDSTYTGPLYQVRRGGDPLGSGGTTSDIGQVDGFGDAAAQDAACGNDSCTVSVLYDQSGQGNDLHVAPAGCYEDGSANFPDYESDARGRELTVGGHRVYALYTHEREGYRNNDPTNFPRDSDPQGIYMVADGTHSGSACCWDFGNASQDNCYGRTGIMSALMLGDGYWGSGAGGPPWFMGDFEGGVWAGGSGDSTANNPNLPSSNHDFAFGILKNTPSNYAIRVGSAVSGGLTTAYDGATPKQLLLNGAIILGIGGDNSNHSWGTFYEGVVTAGRPDDATDDAVLQNVQAAGYGQ